MPTVIMGLRCMAPRIESIRLARTWTERGRSRTVFPNHAILLQSCRSSHSTSQTPHHTRHVWVSTSHDIHTNLALEDWMLQHLDFQHQSHLLLWQNAPCVVIGRHQNPWAECRLPLCRHLDVSIARRLSGGGTVYHDLGNMCLTFFTSRDRYNRENNLEFVCQSLRRYYNVDVRVGDRDDILLGQKYKISGTAAKLVRDKAYHHCTLLLSADKNRLNDVLHSQLAGMQSRATESVRSEVRNLSEEDSRLTFANLVPVLAQEYFLLGGEKGDYRYVDPTNEHQFPDLSSLRTHLRSWEWVYGKTPPFNIRVSHFDKHINLRVEKGQVVSVELESYVSPEMKEAADLLGTELIGTRLNSHELLDITQSLIQTTGSLQKPMGKLVKALENVINNT